WVSIDLLRRPFPQSWKERRNLQPTHHGQPGILHPHRCKPSQARRNLGQPSGLAIGMEHLHDGLLLKAQGRLATEDPHDFASKMGQITCRCPKASSRNFWIDMPTALYWNSVPAMTFCGTCRFFRRQELLKGAILHACGIEDQLAH